jgi:hypothetical protein
MTKDFSALLHNEKIEQQFSFASSSAAGTRKNCGALTWLFTSENPAAQKPRHAPVDGLQTIDSK